MESSEMFAAVGEYIQNLFVPSDPVLDAAIRDSAAAGLPAIHVSPSEGKLLYLLAKLSGTRRVLEIGTLGGYSTIWLTRALPADGQLVTLELAPDHARVARANLDRAGLSSQVTIHVGPAAESLKNLVAAGEAPFDLVFIDADKEGYPTYLEWSLKLVHPGSLILIDNVVRHGSVTEVDSHEPTVQSTRRLNQLLAGNPRLESIIVPVIRPHLDGLAIARVK